MNAAPSIRFDATTNLETFAQVVELGDRNNRTLGFLPYAGFRSAAADQRIAVATAADGKVLGSCLFDLPRDVVRIVHLRVAAEARDSNLARALVDAVSARHRDRLGLVLKCRADWPADKFWPKLDFTAQTQVPGRSKQQHPLTVWWRSHGHADLFTLLGAHRLGRAAAIDSNVYSDLHSAKSRQGSKHTAVLAPFIANDELNIMLLPSLEAEIYATTDPTERTRFLNAKVNYTRATSASVRDVVDHLMTCIPNDVLAKDRSLQRDVELLAEAHANGIDLFITRDEGVLQHLRGAAAEFGIEVLHPAEVPTYLDVEQAHHTYQPAQLKETTFIARRLDRALATDETTLLLDKGGGERLTDIRRWLADLAGRSTTDVVRSVLFDGDNNLRAVWAVHESTALEVPLLRIPEGNLQATLAAQLSQLPRIDAIARENTVLRITDPHIPKAVRLVLKVMGSLPTPTACSLSFCQSLSHGPRWLPQHRQQPRSRAPTRWIVFWRYRRIPPRHRLWSSSGSGLRPRFSGRESPTILSPLGDTSHPISSAAQPHLSVGLTTWGCRVSTCTTAHAWARSSRLPESSGTSADRSTRRSSQAQTWSKSASTLRESAPPLRAAGSLDSV